MECGVDVLNVIGDLGHEEVVTCDLDSSVDAVVVDVIKGGACAIHSIVLVDEGREIVDGSFSVHGFLVDLILCGFTFGNGGFAQLLESRVVDVVHVFQAQEGNSH